MSKFIYSLIITSYTTCVCSKPIHWAPLAYHLYAKYDSNHSIELYIQQLTLAISLSSRCNEKFHFQSRTVYQCYAMCHIGGVNDCVVDGCVFSHVTLQLKPDQQNCMYQLTNQPTDPKVELKTRSGSVPAKTRESSRLGNLCCISISLIFYSRTNFNYVRWLATKARNYTKVCGIRHVSGQWFGCH